MIVFNSIDVNFVSNGTLLAYNVLYNGIIRYLRVPQGVDLGALSLIVT